MITEWGRMSITYCNNLLYSPASLPNPTPSKKNRKNKVAAHPGSGHYSCCVAPRARAWGSGIKLLSLIINPQTGTELKTRLVFIIPKIKSLHREINNALGGFIGTPFGHPSHIKLQKVSGITGDESGSNPIF